jgi:hypothetical protein
VALAISAIVAPSFRRRSSRTTALLLPSRSLDVNFDPVTFPTFFVLVFAACFARLAFNTCSTTSFISRLTAGNPEVSFGTSLQFHLQPVVGDLRIHFFQPIQHVVAHMCEYNPLTRKVRPAFG